jgi:peptidyl-prolyl cis-trans isomerase SurA
MRFLLNLFVLAFITCNVFAQYKPNDVLFSINNQKITVEDFLLTYNKNNQPGSPSGETIESYFELFLKFKLKVSAAFDAQLDTLPSFKNEFKGYRDQLAKNYLTDTEILDKLIKEAYFRTATEVNVGHIMVSLSEKAIPSDTLAAYEKINSIRKRVLAGESFEQLAQELSDDPSAKTNKGNIGYFKAFKLPYSFESAAYNTPVGEISHPVRTRFGYHLIKVNNKRTSQGEVKVAHIMAASPQNAPDSSKAYAEIRIKDIYTQLKNGAPFDSLAIKLSDDRYSARNGGELPWFGAGEMVPEFEETSFSLTDKGKISEPIKTFYGWHIIKLLDKKAVPTFESIQTELKSKIIQGDRFPIIEKSFVARLKKQYKWHEFKENLVTFYQPDTTGNPVEIGTPKKLLAIQDSIYTAVNFSQFLKQFPKTPSGTVLKEYIDSKFSEFVDKSFINFENNNLENNNKEFKQTVREYYEGLLLFEIMEREVWSKASKDSAGLEKYYLSNQNRYNNPQPQKLDEIKGIVMSDYQTYIEDNWIAGLKKKYKVTVNTNLLNKIASGYKTKKP